MALEVMLSDLLFPPVSPGFPGGQTTGAQFSGRLTAARLSSRLVQGLPHTLRTGARNPPSHPGRDREVGRRPRAPSQSSPTSHNGQ